MNSANASAPFQKALESSFLKAFDERYNFKSTSDPFCCGIEKLRAAYDLPSAAREHGVGAPVAEHVGA